MVTSSVDCYFQQLIFVAPVESYIEVGLHKRYRYVGAQ